MSVTHSKVTTSSHRANGKESPVTVETGPGLERPGRASPPRPAPARAWTWRGLRDACEHLWNRIGMAYWDLTRRAARTFTTWMTPLGK